MSHIRLAFGFSRHAKISELSDLGFRIWVAGIERASEQLTDGLLKASDLDLLPRMPVKKTARQSVVDELVAAKLWLPVEGGGWRIHDFLEWQDSSSEARKKKEAAKERMRRLRLNGSQIVRANNSDYESNCDGERSREQNDDSGNCSPERSPNVRDLAPAPALSLISSGSLSSPGRPTLSASSEGSDSLSAREAKSKKPRSAKWKFVPADWQPSDEHREIAASRGVDFDLELAKFRDYEFAVPKSNAVATFRNWLRTARPTLRPGLPRGVAPYRQPDSGYSPSAHAKEVT